MPRIPVRVRSAGGLLPMLGLVTALSACGEAANSVLLPDDDWNASSAMAESTDVQTITLASGIAWSGMPGRDSVNQVSTDGGATFIPAFIVQRNWAYAPAIPGSQYIGQVPNAGTSNIAVGTATFRTSFELPDGFSSPSIEVQLYVDNSVTIRLNGQEIGTAGGFSESPRSVSTDDPALFQSGTNVLEIDLVNAGAFPNPAALDYHATVTFLPNGAPTAGPGGQYAGDEGSAIAFDGSRSVDPDGDELSYTWDFGDGGTASGSAPTHTYEEDGTYTATLVVSDGSASDTATTEVTVANVAPSVGMISGLPTGPIPANTRVELRAAFSDPGVLDSHTAAIDWHVGGTAWTTPGTVTQTRGSGSVAGSQAYSAAGIYTVRVALSDDDGGSGAREYHNVVVYDPEAGFLTGGGWIASPAGAYAADPAVTGRLSFGFASRYGRGADRPSGNAEIHLRAGKLNFHSQTQEWLVVSGNEARLLGTGAINGRGDFGFELTAQDGEMEVGDGIDRIRIRIWDTATGAVVYDSQMGDPQDADPTTALGGGNVVIHD